MDTDQNQQAQPPQQTMQESLVTTALPSEPTESKNYISRLRSERLNIRNFIVGVIISFILYMLVFVSVIIIIRDVLHINSAINLSIIAVFFILFLYILCVRRLHDLNKSGFFALLLGVPIINCFFLIYLLFVKGTSGNNNYGNAPLPRINIKKDILQL